MVSVATYRGAFAAVLLLVSGAASAVPIDYNGGLLDGTLRTYRVVDDDFQAPYDLVLVHDYVLGTDFYPAVPTSFITSGTSYAACTHGAANLSLITNSPECLGYYFPLTTEIFGEGDLRDGCSGVLESWGSNPPQPTPVADAMPLIVVRGNCSFSDKWANAEAAGWGGILVVNDAPGAAAPAALVPTAIEPTITFMRVSQDVGADLRAGLHSALLLEMRVTWTPPTPIDEPSLAALLLTGLVGVVITRRRRSG